MRTVIAALLYVILLFLLASCSVAATVTLVDVHDGDTFTVLQAAVAWKLLGGP